MKMIYKQEACRDARLVRPLRWECKSVYIGSCVRARDLKTNSMVVEANARSVLSGRTNRASLHALAQLAMSGVLITNDLHLAFQSQPFCTIISPISPRNMAHLTVQCG